MNNPILIFLWLIATYLVVQFVWAFYQSYFAVTKELELKLMKHLDSIIHRVDVVKENDVMYWYDKDNGKFLGQGRTNEELIDHIKERFPDHMFFLRANGEDCVVARRTDWQPVKTDKVINVKL